MKPTVFDKAYAAGLIDGEGCIMIATAKRQWTTNAKSDQHFLRVVVHMTSLKTLKWLQRRWHGCVCKRRRQRNTPKHWRESYQWEATCNQAHTLLNDIFPYLIIKKAEADVALQFKAQIRRSGSWPGKLGQALMTRAEQEFRLKLKRKLQQLKQVA